MNKMQALMMFKYMKTVSDTANRRPELRLLCVEILSNLLTTAVNDILNTIKQQESEIYMEYMLTGINEGNITQKTIREVIESLLEEYKELEKVQNEEGEKEQEKEECKWKLIQ